MKGNVAGAAWSDWLTEAYHWRQYLTLQTNSGTGAHWLLCPKSPICWGKMFTAVHFLSLSVLKQTWDKASKLFNIVFFQFYHKEQTNNSGDLLHVLMSQRMTERGQKSQFCTQCRIMKHKTCTKSQCSTCQHTAFEMLTESRSEHFCHHLPPQTILHSDSALQQHTLTNTPS